MAKIKGIWVLNATLTAKESENALAQVVSFTSNGIAFDIMLLLGDYTSALTYSNQEDSYSVYTHSGGWVNEAYRIVDFGSAEQDVSDEWYASFTANAAPASNPDEPDEPTEEDDEILAIKKSTLKGIANAVRSKTGKTALMLGSEIEGEIRGISGGKTLPKYDGEVIIEGEPESGGGGGGSAEFNIAYGDTPPEDTTKLWVKANEPEAVSITSSPVFEAGEIEAFAQTLPTAAGGIASALVGTKIYLFGGVGDAFLSTINVFDTESKTITTLSTTLPKAASDIAPAVVGTKVYLFGGSSVSVTRLNTINVFDTENNSIETLNVTLPSATSGIASAVVGTKVYLFGGYSGSASSAIYVFNTENNTISALSTQLPGTAYNIASAVVGTKVYLFGGQRSDQYNFSTIDVFDTENNTITTLSATLPKAAYNIASAVAGTKVYLFGGYNYSSYYRSTIYVFDAKNNSISTLSTTLPTAASNIASVLVGTKVYLFGGQKNGGYLNTVDVFNISMPLASNTMIIEATKSKNIFNLFSNVEIGIEAVYLGNADGNGERVDAYLHNGTEWVEV